MLALKSAKKSTPSIFQRGQWITLMESLHEAERAGRHLDIRLGTEETGLFSWATKSKFPTESGESILLIEQPIHPWEYQAFSGEIEEGYGKGFVHPPKIYNALILSASKDRLDFALDRGKYIERFRLQRLASDPKKWLLINITPDPKLPKKLRYKLIDEIEAKELVHQVGQSIFSVQPKIDGALVYITVKHGGDLDIFSHRISKITGRPILHTERVLFPDRVNKVNPQFVGTILLGELYGVQRKGNKERILTPIELASILNSGLYRSKQLMDQLGIELRIYLFDVAKMGRKPFDPRWFENIPYSERRKFIDRISAYLPENIHGPIDEAFTKQEASKLLETIQKQKHSLTREGVIFHKLYGVPLKYKIFNEMKLYIVGFTPGEGKYKNAVGGILVSDKPGGKPIATVGTGLSDELRFDMAKDPNKYIGKRVTVAYQERLPSGGLRAPVLVEVEEEL